VTTRDLALTALFAALTAVCAQVSLALPGISSVPFTLQVFAVLASGAVLGARRGFLSQLIYLLLGAAGAPVFARFHGGPQVLVGPTAGYLTAFPLAAFLVGWSWDASWAPAQGARAAAPRAPLAWAGMAAGLLCIYICGALGLVATHTAPTLARAFMVGVVPFVPLDLVKAILAGFVAQRLRAVIPVLQAPARGR
jgi:biotin transport system substrate-specific component